MNKIGLFDYTTNFCTGKSDYRLHPNFEKYPAFMVNRVLSMSPKTCHLAMFMSTYDNVPNAQHFKFYLDEVDPEDIYFNYAKRSDEIPEKDIGYIREYYQCNLGRALEYIRLMSKKQLDTILEMYHTRDAKIKKTKTKE